MKRITSTLATVLSLTGICALASPSKAQVVQSGREEIFSVIGDPVNEEPVQIVGEAHYLIKERVRKDGTTLMELRISTHGAGMGLWSGNPYQFNETYTYSWIDQPGLEYQIDSTDMVRLISRGGLANATIEQTMSIIRDVNGVYSFEFAYEYDAKGRGG